MARAPTKPGLLAFVELWIFRQAQHISEDTISAGDTKRKLTIEGIGVVDISSLSVPRVYEAAILRVLLSIMGFEQGLVSFIPGNEKFRSAFFDPPIKVLRCDDIRPGKERIL